MRLTKYFAAAAALSLTAVPALADTNPAASLSLSHSTRVGGNAKHGDDLLGGSGIIIVILAVIAIGAGIGIAVSNSGSN